MDRTNYKALREGPGGDTVSTLDGRGADDRHDVELGAPVAVADTSERAQLRVGNEAAAVEDVALQARLDRAEEMAGQLYKLAEAAQAAVDVLRAKLAEAEAEIDRVGRGRTAVAAELSRQTNAHMVLQSLREELERKCDALAAEAFHIARDRDRLVTDLARVETMATDRAMAAEMTENAAALKAGELKLARAELARLETMVADRAMAAEMAEHAAALKAGELTQARAETTALDLTMLVRMASLQTELARVETMAADRAMGAEMAEHVAALKAGELKRARAEIAALSARIPRTWREAARLLRSR